MAEQAILYSGFSSQNWVNGGKSFNLKNIELVKRDLLNHIYTAFGDRVHMISFGTRVPDMTFEPNDPVTIGIIDEDLRRVFDYDPRVELLALDIYSTPNSNAIYAIANVKYIEFNITENLNIEVAFGQGSAF